VISGKKRGGFSENLQGRDGGARMGGGERFLMLQDPELWEGIKLCAAHYEEKVEETGGCAVLKTMTDSTRR